MGQFAQLTLPLADSVKLTLQLNNSDQEETITVSFRIRLYFRINDL